MEPATNANMAETSPHENDIAHRRNVNTINHSFHMHRPTDLGYKLGVAHACTEFPHNNIRFMNWKGPYALIPSSHMSHRQLVSVPPVLLMMCFLPGLQRRRSKRCKLNLWGFKFYDMSSITPKIQLPSFLLMFCSRTGLFCLHTLHNNNIYITF